MFLLLGLMFGAGLCLLLWVLRGQRKAFNRYTSPLWGAVVGSFVVGTPAGAVLGAAVSAGWPFLRREYRSINETIEKKEAVATWVESLRDSVGGVAGLTEGIASSASLAPLAIRDDVMRLRSRLRGREPLASALDSFGEEVADTSADLVVAALKLAHVGRARNLAVVLSAVAIAARDEAGMYRQVQAGRAQMIFAGSMVVIISALIALSLALFNPELMSSYDSPLGQVVLLAVGAIFFAGAWYLVRLARVEEQQRYFVETGGARG